MNKFCFKDINIKTYQYALKEYLEKNNSDVIATTLLILLDRFLGENGSNQPNEEKLEIVKDICDEYLNIKIESPSNYDHIFVVVKIEEMPEDLKNNLIITAKQPSEREQKIRNNIDKLRDR